MAYTFLLKKNNAKSTVSSLVQGSDTTILVTSLIPFPEVGTGSFLVTIWNRNTYPDPSDDPNAEIVKVTSVSSGNMLIVVRAQEGTLARLHNVGDAVEMLLTRGHLLEYETQINNIVDLVSYTQYGGF